MFRQLLKSTFILTILALGAQTCYAQRSCEPAKAISKAKGELEVEGTYTVVAGDTIKDVIIVIYKDNNLVKTAPADYASGIFKGIVIGLDSAVTYEVRMIMNVVDSDSFPHMIFSKKNIKAITK